MKTLQGNKSVLKQQYDTTYTTEKVWCIKFNKTSKIYMFKRRTGVSRPWICHRILLRLCAKLSLRISTCEHLFFYAFSIKSSMFKEIIACTSKNNFVLCGSITSRLEQQQWNEGNKKIKKAIIQKAKQKLWMCITLLILVDFFSVIWLKLVALISNGNANIALIFKVISSSILNKQLWIYQRYPCTVSKMGQTHWQH